MTHKCGLPDAQLFPNPIINYHAHCTVPYTLYPTLPYPTLPYPTLPYPTLPYPTLPYPTLPYPTLPYLPYPTLPYPTLSSLLPCPSLTSEFCVFFRGIIMK